MTRRFSLKPLLDFLRRIQELAQSEIPWKSPIPPDKLRIVGVGVVALFVVLFTLILLPRDFLVEEPPPPTPTLWIGGNVHLDTLGFEAFSKILPLVQGPGIISLQGPISKGLSGPKPTGTQLFNGTRTAQTLSAARVRAAGIANNHSLLGGEHSETMTAWALRNAGVHAMGGPAGMALLEVEGISVAVTAHNLVGRLPPRIDGELRAAASAADVFVATLHAEEDRRLPSRLVNDAVKLALSAGAQVVVVHGSHMVGPVERRDDAVVAWGLGDVLYSYPVSMKEDAVLLQVELTTPVRARIIPITTGLGGNPARPSRKAADLLDFMVDMGSQFIERDEQGAWF